MQAENYGTGIIEKSEKIVEEIIDWILSSNELSMSVTSGGMQFSYDYFFETKKKVLDKHRRGEHKGVRFITFIDKDNIDVIKKYLDAGAKIKHVKNLPPMSLGISDKQALTTLEKMEDGKEYIVTLIHNMGEKWSLYLSGTIGGGIRTTIGVLPKFEVTKSSLIIRFTVS